jgi:endoglucanase
MRRLLSRAMRAGILALAALALSVPGSAGAASRTLDPTTQFYNPLIPDAAYKQINELIAHGRRADAELIRKMEEQPRAVWFTKGTPKEVAYKVSQTVAAANKKNQMAVLVAYNIPGRDCANLSAGGALTTPEYMAWIDAFAAGIGSSRAIVILEPDGLGLLPGTNCGGAPSNPTYPFTDAQRYTEMNYAVDKLAAAAPNALVYLDGTHSHWLSTGDIALRLVTGGVQRAQGFYLNASNYQGTPQGQKYGNWISQCIAFANNPEEGGWRLGHYDWCGSQYFPANADDFSTWHLTDQWYMSNLGHAVPVQRFVIDTSRNGQGPWTPTRSYPDAQDWCNPPGRGVGRLASAIADGTSNTIVPAGTFTLLDAYLWIKIPGESDGSCARGLGTPGVTVDPEWGLVDPRAGDWFPQQALQLAQLANPPLKPR